MRRLIAALAVTMLGLVAVSAATLGGEVLDRVMEKKTLVNAVEGEFPPFNSLGENNELVGFDIDVAKELAKRLGVKLNNITMGWDVITAGRWANRWDITVGSMAVTKTGREVLEFPFSYYFMPAIILVHKDNSTIGELGDLTGKRVGAQVATTNEKFLQKNLKLETPVNYDFENVQIVSHETEPTVIDDLSLGDGVRLDAAIVGILTAQEHIKSGKPLKIVAEPVFHEEVSVAVDKGDPEFVAKVKETLEAMRADGTLKKLSEDRFGVDITAPPTGS